MSDERFREIIEILTNAPQCQQKCARLTAALAAVITGGGAKAANALEEHIYQLARIDELYQFFPSSK